MKLHSSGRSTTLTGILRWPGQDRDLLVDALIIGGGHRQYALIELRRIEQLRGVFDLARRMMGAQLRAQLR